MFNNTMFSARTIAGMAEIHPTTERLYSAARELRDVIGQSAVARLLDISPQVMKNWEARGVSEGGALKAQKYIGCDANWVLHGEQQMASTAWAPPSPGHSTQDKAATYQVAKTWPFNTFTPDEYFKLLDAEYRQKIEDQLLGAITRMKQATQPQLDKHA
ncbi:hypothetical protein GmRootA79_16340 [Acidovorax sp. A79]